MILKAITAILFCYGVHGSHINNTKKIPKEFITITHKFTEDRNDKNIKDLSLHYINTNQFYTYKHDKNKIINDLLNSLCIESNRWNQSISNLNYQISNNENIIINKLNTRRRIKEKGLLVSLKLWKIQTTKNSITSNYLMIEEPNKTQNIKIILPKKTIGPFYLSDEPLELEPNSNAYNLAIMDEKFSNDEVSNFITELLRENNDDVTVEPLDHEQIESFCKDLEKRA
ncbi:MAG: hypothetical protein KC505_10770 [Myxococcales bacterium]|nr:hypothetical protein [Myxococcales bacterium]USN50048.1 MAG: hypothetical protein H6731_07175 [Myxococcales bacterium]